jgi:hypothetical protein
MSFGLMTGFIGLLDTPGDYTLQYIVTHTRAVSIVHISRCLVAAFNGGRFSSSGFPNCPQPQLPASNRNSSQQLNPRILLTNSLTA